MGNSASALPYSIGKQVAQLPNGWTLHQGQQKSDGRTVWPILDDRAYELFERYTEQYVESQAE